MLYQKSKIVMGIILAVFILFSTVQAESSADVILGEWIDTEYLGQKYTILNRTDKIILACTFQDGRKIEREMIEIEPSRYRIKDKTDIYHVLYFYIDEDGYLYIGDKDGIDAGISPIN